MAWDDLPPAWDAAPPPKKKQPIYMADKNPMSVVAKAAPSNLMKLMGVAGANAPDAANLILSGLPGLGTPGQVLPSIQALKKNPGQVVDAAKRVAQVSQGSELNPVEKLPARIGQVGGTLLEMAAMPTLNAPKIKPTGPLTAGIAEPRTALPRSFEKAGEELGAARTAARGVDDAQEAARLRRLLNTPTGRSKVAEEGKAAVEAGNDLSVTQLEAYEQAMGEMQAKGGVFANDYAQARKAAREMLQWKAPELVDKLQKMAVNYAAKGDPKAFPWLTLAINPKVGILKTATAPTVRNLTGAALGSIAKEIPSISSAANAVLPKELKNPVIPPAALTLTLDKAKEFLKKAKGNRDKARKMAQDAGYVIPEVQ